MSKFKSLLTSALFTIISVVSLTLTVLGQNFDNNHEVEPIGGVVATVNKLAIVAPYIIVGIVAVASIVYIIKKRKH